MKRKKIYLFVFIFISLCVSNVFSQMRSFNDIFPSISSDIRSSIFTDKGYVKSSRRTDNFYIFGNQQGVRLDPQLVNIVLNRNPGYIVESVMVIQQTQRAVTLLDVYNALSNVRGLKGRLYDSTTRNRAVPLFEDATRIVSQRQTTAIPDPSPAANLPKEETLYIRLKDVNFGNTYYRGEMALVQNGLRYTLLNFRNMTYLLVPVLREEKFIAQLYVEPIREGILIYSIAGADISDFVASKIDIDSAISKRLAVITAWAADGIRN